jgi:hypothetical protein
MYIEKKMANYLDGQKMRRIQLIKCKKKKKSRGNTILYSKDIFKSKKQSLEQKSQRSKEY